MADILAEIEFKPRFKPRTQTAFVRASKGASTPASAANSSSKTMLIFGNTLLMRLDDMNSHISLCALNLLEREVDIDPAKIRDSVEFRQLIERKEFGLQSSTGTSKTSYKASLLLLEVFIYMITFQRAQREFEDLRAATARSHEQTLLT